MHIIRLSESIQHLEDLPIDEFVRVIEKLPRLIAQEKLDGAQLWLGVDSDGRFFTSREGKRSTGERYYDPASWPMLAAFNQFRAAHTALAAKEQDLRRVLRVGDTVEAEVLFGRQPNSVIYGAGGRSYIAFLRGVGDTPDKIADDLGLSMAHQQVQIKVNLVDTTDGRDLETRSKDVTFQFVTPKRLDTAKLEREADVNTLLNDLQDFLDAPSPVKGLSNLMLCTTVLTSVKQADREMVKKARADVIQHLQIKYKLPIKNALLGKLHPRSDLAAVDITPDEDVGIEGIVLRDPDTGEQVKVVDRDVFTSINKFNQLPRNAVQSSLNTVDPDAPLEARGGLVGELRIKIADVLGNRELAKPSVVRKFLEPIKGDSPEQAIRNLVKSMPNLDDFQATKQKILALLQETYRELDEKLEGFKRDKDSYRLKLKTGKEIGLSDETVKKTLLTFAEARRNLNTLFDKLKGTKTFAQLLAVLYGGSALAVHAPATPVSESLLLEKRKRRHHKHGEISVTEFERKDTLQLVSAYLATVMMTFVVYHTNDAIGMRLLRDRKNQALQRHSIDMSPLNHWGFAIWRVAKHELDGHVTRSTRTALVHATKKIPTPWWRYLHIDFSANKELDINWNDHRRTLTRLIELSGVRSERLNTLLDLSIRFPNLDRADQQRTIKKLMTYVLLFVPRSSLYPRLKVILSKIEDEKMTEGLLKQVHAMVEDEGGDFAGTAVAGATTSSAIAAVPTKLGGAKTEMRRRNTSRRFLTLTRKYVDPRNKGKE